MADAINPADFKTYHDFQDAITQSPRFQQLRPDDPARTRILGIARDKFYEAHGVHKDLGPTDITPSDPTKREGTATVEGATTNLPEPKGPLTEAPPTSLGGPTKPEEPDFAGRVKAGAEGVLAASNKYRGAAKGPIPDPIDLLIHALPGDNIQAGIDAAMALSMLTGAGEVEGAGGIAYKILRAIPAPLRGVARLAARTSITAGGGAAGGATEGKAGQGALQGTAEQMVGEGISAVGRGIFGLANKAIQRTDLKRLSGWLSEKIPGFPGMKSLEDFRKLFSRGELEESAGKELTNVEAKVGKTLTPKGAVSTPKSTVFAPSAQDKAQAEALAGVKGEKPGAMGETPQAPPKTVFAPQKPDPDAAYKKVKDIENELKAARAQKGSGLSAENKARDEKIADIHARLEQAKAEARAATKEAKTPSQTSQMNERDAAAKAQGEQLRSRPSSYAPLAAAKVASSSLKVELPGPMADYLRLPRRKPIEFTWEDITRDLKEVENKGWALIGSNDPAQVELGRSLRSAVFQAESDVADALRAKVGDQVADQWLAQRRGYRAARVLTNLFREPNVTEPGMGGALKLNWEEVQKQASEAGKQGYYDDLKLAFGKDGADSFVSNITRGEPGVRDIPGKGIFSPHSKVYIHPQLGKLSSRFGLQIPFPAIRAGDVPFNLGRNRVLSALAVLGPERFVLLMDDLGKMGLGDLGTMTPNKPKAAPTTPAPSEVYTPGTPISATP